MDTLVDAASTKNRVKFWEPSKFALGATLSSQGPQAVCILNQPLENRDLLLKICHKALLVVCADGGANQLKELGLTEEEETRCPVAAICGDFDSVRPEVLSYYEVKGARLYHDPDQYSTDLTKSLRYLDEQLSRQTPDARQDPDRLIDVAILGGHGGRADQYFSLYHQLYLHASSSKGSCLGNLFLVTPESIVFLLEKGANTIHTPVASGLFTPNVGIIPLGRPSVITTKGLEWDVNEWPTEFGGQVSTSNHITADTVEVNTTERVLFTMEFAS